MAAPCTLAQTRKQPNSRRTDEWIKKMGYIYTIQYYSAMNKMKVCRFQPQKSIKEMILSEVREGEASIMMSLLDGI